MLKKAKVRFGCVFAALLALHMQNFVVSHINIVRDGLFYQAPTHFNYKPFSLHSLRRIPKKNLHVAKMYPP